MNRATLRQLQVFEAVARRLSFSRAAEELHLTQPAVSSQVRQLEGHAGLPLLEQIGKKIYLTAAGNEMLRHSRSIIQQFRAAGDAMAGLKGISGGTLAVAVISAGDYFFPQLLAAFGRHHEGVTVQLGLHNRQELLRQLDENLTDLAVMVRPPHDMDTINESFAPAPYVIVVAPDHPLTKRGKLSLASLKGTPFVVRERGSDTWNAMQEAFGRGVSNLEVSMEIKSTETIKQAVIAGMGASFLSAHTISLELQVGSLAVLPVQGFPFLRNWYVVHRRSKRLPPVALAFRSFLLEDGAALIKRVTRFEVQSLDAKRPPPARKTIARQRDSKTPA